MGLDSMVPGQTEIADKPESNLRWLSPTESESVGTSHSEAKHDLKVLYIVSKTPAEMGKQSLSSKRGNDFLRVIVPRGGLAVAKWDRSDYRT